MNAVEMLNYLKDNYMILSENIISLEDIKENTRKVRIHDKYGELEVNKSSLSKGCKWTIQSATDKNKYYLNMLKEKNVKAHGEIELVGEIISLSKKCIFKDSFGLIEVRPQNMLNGDTPSIASAIDKDEYFLNKLKVYNSYAYENLEMIGTYLNGREKVLFKDEYGVISISPSRLLEGHIFKINSAIDKTKYWTNKAIQVHGKKYEYSNVKYVNTSVKVEIICKEHGSFYQVPSYHISGNGCPTCGLKYNKSEKECIEIVSNVLSLECEPQKTWDWLKFKSNMFCDGYFSEIDLVVEYNGEQHRESIDFFGGDKTFKNTIMRDKKKRQLLSDNNIKCLTIWFDDDWRNKDWLAKQLTNLGIQIPKTKTKI